MTHEFEVREEITLEATPEQVWEAIATGPGIDSWFMGRNEIEPREGGRGRMTLSGWTSESTVTAYEPGKRFGLRSDDNPDGTFMAFEYLIEAADEGSSVLRFVHSGFLGDDWEDEYNALKVGDRMYLEKLALVLKYFPGQTSTYTMFLAKPDATGEPWARFREVLGLTGAVTPGEPVRLSVPGLQPVDGYVAFAHEPNFLGVRADDGIHMLITGHTGAVVVEFHAFVEVDPASTEQAWQSWLDTTFA
jgi:uncharacterized protein YndB with AHSA1/START domain